MAHVLVIYGTTEGQTQKIATVIAETLRERGHTVDLSASTRYLGPLDADAVDGVIVGGSVHSGRHQAAILRFVEDNRPVLSTLPTAFFSVSLAVMDDAHHDEEAQAYVDDFCEETGWSPDLVETIAGALRYTQYGFVKRYIMKQISKRAGRPTDTSRDYEFTDWAQVEQFVDRFLRHLEEAGVRDTRPPTPWEAPSQQRVGPLGPRGTPREQ